MERHSPNQTKGDHGRTRAKPLNSTQGADSSVCWGKTTKIVDAWVKSQEYWDKEYMKTKLKEDNRPNSQTGVFGAGFSHRCLFLVLVTTQDKKVAQKAFPTYNNSNIIPNNGIAPHSEKFQYWNG